MFDKFAVIRRNIPRQTDVEQIAIEALAKGAQSSDKIYDFLYHEIREGVTGEYERFCGDWKYVREHGSIELVEHYSNQTVNQLTTVESAAKSMCCMDNSQSLLSRIKTQLNDALKDINRGSFFVYRVIDQSERFSLVDVIDYMISINRMRWEQEAAQTDLRYNDFLDARDRFENRRKRSIFESDAKRFDYYEYCLNKLYPLSRTF